MAQLFGLNPTEIATAVGVSRTYVSRLLSERDSFIGSSNFYRRLKVNLAKVIENRTRQVFAIAAVQLDEARPD